MSRHKDDPVGDVVTGVGARRTRPRDMIVRGALTLVLIGLVGWLLLKNMGEISEVADALKGVSAADAWTLVILLLVTQVLVAAQLATTVPGIRMTRAFVAVESAAAASNIIPGPSGTATRLAVLRSWGFYTDDFARSWLFTSALTNFTVLAMPAFAIVLVATQNSIETGLLILALVGLVISLVALYCIIRIMRSEGFARHFGALTGRVVRWFYGLARRQPSDEDFVAATLRFREGIAQTWKERGLRVSAAVVGNYVVQGVIFGLSIRAVGLDSSDVPLGAIAVVYTIVRLLTIVNFTPGGVGVTEALYTTALLTVTDGADQSLVVAAVFLFRGLTYIGPILLGAVSLLIWRFRSSWRVHRPEPVAEASVGAVLADREPPTP
jgi:putative heme transporter